MKKETRPSSDDDDEDEPPPQRKPKAGISAVPVVKKKARPAYDDEEVSDDERPEEKSRKVKGKKGKAKKAKSKKGLILVGVLALGFCFLLCAGGGFAVWHFWPGAGTDDFVYFPDGINSINAEQVAQRRDSAAFKEITKAMGKDPEVEQFEKQYGLHADNVDRRAIGSNNGPAAESITVMRTKSAVQASDIIAQLKQGDSKLDFNETTVGKYKVNEPKTGGPGPGAGMIGFGPTAFCVVDGKTIIYGQTKTIRSVLEHGKKPEFSAGMQAALKLVNFRSSMTRVQYVGANKGTNMFFGGGFGIGQIGNNQKLESVVEETQIGTDINVQETYTFSDGTGANEAKKAYDENVQKQRNDPMFKDMMGDIEASASVSGNTLNAKAKIPAKTIAKLMGGMNKPGGK